MKSLLYRTKYIALALLGEVAYLYPMYYLFASGFKTPPDSCLALWQMLLFASFALLVNFVLALKSRHIFTIIGVHLIMAFLAIYILTWDLYASNFQLVNITAALQNFFSWNNGGKFEILSKWNFLVFMFWIWLRAIILFRIRVSYSKATNRFELGVVSIFLIFLLAGVLNISIPETLSVLILFFLCHTGALAFTKQGEENQGTFLIGLGFIAILFVPLTLALRLVLPFINRLADGFYGIATPVLAFFRDILGNILLFIFKGANLVPQNPSASDSPSLGSSASSGGTLAELPSWLGGFIKIFAVLLMVIAFIALLILIVYLVRRLFYKLLNIERQDETLSVGRGDFSFWLLGLVNRLKEGLLRGKYFLLAFFPARHNIAKLYYVMLKWGSYKKHPRERHETPSEYCQRLSLAFPYHKEKLETITNAYVAFKYGEKEPTPETRKKAGESLRKVYFSGLKKRVNKHPTKKHK